MLPFPSCALERHVPALPQVVQEPDSAALSALVSRCMAACPLQPRTSCAACAKLSQQHLHCLHLHCIVMPAQPLTPLALVQRATRPHACRAAKPQPLLGWPTDGGRDLPSPAACPAVAGGAGRAQPTALGPALMAATGGPQRSSAPPRQGPAAAPGDPRCARPLVSSLSVCEAEDRSLHP